MKFPTHARARAFRILNRVMWMLCLLCLKETKHTFQSRSRAGRLGDSAGGKSPTISRPTSRRTTEESPTHSNAHPRNAQYSARCEQARSTILALTVEGAKATSCNEPQGMLFQCAWEEGGRVEVSRASLSFPRRLKEGKMRHPFPSLVRCATIPVQAVVDIVASDDVENVRSTDDSGEGGSQASHPSKCQRVCSPSDH